MTRGLISLVRRLLIDVACGLLSLVRRPLICVARGLLSLVRRLLIDVARGLVSFVRRPGLPACTKGVSSSSCSRERMATNVPSKVCAARNIKE